MERPTCETCPYWDGDHSVKGIGYCKRNAPVPIILPLRGELPNDYHIGDDPTFAELAGTDWCGEHPQFPAYIESLKPVPVPPKMCARCSVQAASDGTDLCGPCRFEATYLGIAPTTCDGEA